MYNLVTDYNLSKNKKNSNNWGTYKMKTYVAFSGKLREVSVVACCSQSQPPPNPSRSALTFRECLVNLEYMRGTVALLLLSAKCRFRQMYSMNGLRGLFTSSIPKKQETNEGGETGLATKEMIDPIVAFSRPPPVPPVIGPLVALTLCETWWNKGSDEDRK